MCVPASQRIRPFGRHWRLLWLLLAAWALVVARPVAAQTATPTPAVEIDLGRFILLSPPEYEADLQGFAAAHSSELDQAYTQLQTLYGISLTLPINLRVYTDWPQFINLNTTPGTLIASPYHTHVGSREIALIGPLPAGMLASPAGLSMAHHELSGLFLDELSAGTIPDGLALGINQYVETPGEQTEAAAARLRSAVANGQSGLLPWPDLIEGTAVHVDRELASAQALSVAAFLVQRFGFDALLEVVRGMGQGHSYRSAMTGIYGQSLEELEAGWREFLPGYAEGGWQHNALYNYDVAHYEAARDSGAYAQVAAALDRVLPFLELTGQSDAHAQAQVLLEEARQGLAARELTASLGQALQAGNYEEALQIALEAQNAYAAIGDAANASVLSAHADYIQQILSLREELTAVEARAAAGPNDSVEQDLLALVPRFQELGDAEGEQRAIETLNGLYGLQADQAARRRETSSQIITLAAVVALVLLALEGVRLLAARRRREPHIL